MRSGFAATNREDGQNPQSLIDGSEGGTETRLCVDNEENELGLRYVDAPIKDDTRAMVGAISVVSPSARLSNQQISAVGRLVTTAEEISEKLGYEKPIKSEGAVRTEC